MNSGFTRWGAFSRPIAFDSTLSAFERAYVKTFGAPILGLRIRARYLLPVIARLHDDEITKIVDAGSGRGLFTFYLARTFPRAEVIGFDINREQVERNNAIARSLDCRNCRFAVQDVTRLSPDEGYDFILSTDNLEHLEDDHAQCRMFHDALRPGGLILFHVPHFTRNVFGWRRTNFMGIEGHVRPGYTIRGLTAMLKENGFDIEESFYSYTSIETLANDVSYLITGGRERRKAVYAVAFPVLLGLSQLGRITRPHEGSGVVVLARRRPTSATGSGTQR